MDVPGAKAYQAHARATLEQGSVCVVLSPSREIKVFAEGAGVFAFRGASWHLLDLKAKYELWAEAVGNGPLALRLFQTALDLADARSGALFVVVRDPAEAVPQLVAPADRLDIGARPERFAVPVPSRREVLHLLEGRRQPPRSSVLRSLTTDGQSHRPRGATACAGAILATLRRMNGTGDS